MCNHQSRSKLTLDPSHDVPAVPGPEPRREGWLLCWQMQRVPQCAAWDHAEHKYAGGKDCEGAESALS